MLQMGYQQRHCAVRVAGQRRGQDVSMLFGNVAPASRKWHGQPSVTLPLRKQQVP
jgi:hypothetical protein